MLVILMFALIAIFLLMVYRNVTGSKGSFSGDLDHRWFSLERELQAGAVMVEPVQQQEPVPLDEVEPIPFVVRHFNSGAATLMMRHRPGKKGCTAKLIVWSGRKRRKIQDSYYDLGLIKADGVGAEVIEEFIEMAKAKLDEIAEAGKQKQQQRKAAKIAALEAVGEAGTVPDVTAPQPQSIEYTPSHADEQKPDATATAKRFDSVIRGTIQVMGVMPKKSGDKEVPVYGVIYRTADGIEDKVWGSDLKTQLRKAKAGVGDEVEILKIGRKIIEEGKAPMTLYKVAKLQKE